MVIARKSVQLPSGVVERLDALERVPNPSEAIAPVGQELAQVRQELHHNARAKWNSGNKYWKVTVEIAGHQFDFDAATFQALPVHPHVADDGLWWLMHEDKLIPFVQDIVRYMRYDQRVKLNDGSTWRLLRDPVTTADRQAYPSLDATGLWARES